MIPPRSVFDINNIQTTEDVEVFGNHPINVLDEPADATEAFIQNLILTNKEKLNGHSLQDIETFFFTSYFLEFDWNTSGAFPRALDLENELQVLVKEGELLPIEGL